MFWWKMAMAIAAILGYGIVAVILLHYIQIVRRRTSGK